MHETIYAVDDSKMNLNIAKSVLGEHYKVILLLSAAEMFESLKIIVPDMILLDLVMPEMDGMTALNLLKKNHADIPVILVTSTRDASVEARGFEMGVTDFITKPFSAPVLLNRIKAHLERTAQHKENIRLIQEIERQKHEAEIANKAKSTFLSRMSHEIRSPMNAIIGISEIRLAEKSLDAENREAFERIYTSGDLLLGIINDILDLSKIEAGKMEINIGKYEIASLISDTAQLNMMRVGNKPIQFELKIDEHLPATMLGDELRLKQIFNNLLSNAFKYTSSGTVTLTVSSEFPKNKKNNDEVILIFKVQDTGQGMSKEQVDMLYDEYSRFNEKANRVTEGTGLGMTITRDLVNLMRGNISVESEPNVGSTFTVRLPQQRSGDEELGKEMAGNLHKFRSNSRMRMIRTQITREPMPYGKILVVDDVETNIYVAKGLLASYELSIDSAESGYEAIDIIKSGKKYDVIFMDHMMPRMDGVETTKVLRKLGYSWPIVALTANAVAGQAGFFLENGFDDFISKPIDIREMNRILNELIRDKQPLEVLEEARKNAESNLQNNSPESHSSIFLNIVIPGLDIDKGLERYLGDEKTYITILRSYAASVGSMLNEIEAIVTEFPSDIPADKLTIYRTKVHGIKGTSLDLYAEQVGKEAKDLEDAAKTGDLKFIKNKTKSFILNTRELVASIEEMLRSFDAENPKPKKDKPDKNILLDILAACKKYHMNKMDEAMTEIEKYQYEADDGLVSWLKESIDSMDFEKIVEKLSGLNL